MFRNIFNLLVIYLFSLPQSLVSKGLFADDWIKSVSTVIGGKGGGNRTSAQASGPHVGSLEEAVSLARDFARIKIGE